MAGERRRTIIGLEAGFDTQQVVPQDLLAGKPAKDAAHAIVIGHHGGRRHAIELKIMIAAVVLFGARVILTVVAIGVPGVEIPGIIKPLAPVTVDIGPGRKERADKD